MANVNLDRPITAEDVPQLVNLLRSVFKDLEDQLTNLPVAYGSVDPSASFPELQKNDLTVQLDANGNFILGIQGEDQRATLTLYTQPLSNMSGFKGLTQTGNPPSLTEYPEDGDWGFHIDDTPGTYYFVRNFGGALKSALMA